MPKLIITLSSSTGSTQNIRNSLVNARKNHVSDFVYDAANSMTGKSCSVQLANQDDVAASATVTMTFASQTDGDTIQIGAMTLTAKTSGATGAQFNIGASNTASAVSLAAAINANSSGLLYAKSAVAVVTVYATTTGVIGNAIPIILTQTSAGMTAAAALSGGLADTASVMNFNNFR